jgi:hypothetical protein
LTTATGTDKDHRNAMRPHKFAVGQVVEFVASASDVHVTPGRYIVQQLLQSESPAISPKAHSAEPIAAIKLAADD